MTWRKWLRRWRRIVHAKPVSLQARLIEALTHPREIVIDPAAGTYSVLEAASRGGRRFLGCDLLAKPNVEAFKPRA